MTAEQRPLAAFTLIELLAALGILALLAAIAISGISAAKRAGERAAAVANMRQIGVAISLYSNEHDAQLPGPLWPGQIPFIDPSRPGRLVAFLAPYLSLDPAKLGSVDLFIPPAYRQTELRSQPIANWRTFVANMNVETAPGEIAAPWGNLAAGGTPAPTRMTSLTDPASTWALSDADQLHPSVATAPWRAFTPAKPIHGGKRATLYFDGRVALVPAGD